MHGLISVKDAIYIEESNVIVYVSQRQERLLKATWRRKNIDEVQISKEHKDRKKRERIEDWIGKEFHVQFERNRSSIK